MEYSVKLIADSQEGKNQESTPPAVCGCGREKDQPEDRECKTCSLYYSQGE